MQPMIKRVSLLALALVLSQPPGAFAQERRVPESRADVQASFAPLVKKTAGAVVNVYAERVVERLRRRVLGPGRVAGGEAGREEGQGARSVLCKP